MRVIIAMEGKKTPLQQILEPGSLQWGPDPIPIVPAGDFLDQAIGAGTDLRREDNGMITAEIPDGLLPENKSVTIYCTGVMADDGRRRDDTGAYVMHISKATIRMLYFDDPGFWPRTPEES